MSSSLLLKKLHLQGKEFIMSDEELKKLVKELVNVIKKNLSIDWTEHENVKSKVRVTVKRLLRKHGFSPVKYPPTIKLIMEQAHLLYKDWPAIYRIEFQGQFMP